ncbi:GrpB family protein [Virgibacillus sp. SK37]|uniref:GrpB family protein n=1 Tax=Virgibacillus sp. SK37 TaxID=403957 RepID=UPI0004D1F005|nr:GrpB family protein [Virgibacillus sp. SK37]AIF42851.1 hypothetical protein X953_06135 [Virgibacillus sp. SK37]
MRKVQVCSYNPAWADRFNEEAVKLQQIFGDLLQHIYHIGSTSVPGLKAKPIIDIMPVVKDIEKVDSYNEGMQRIGYEPMGEYGIPRRRFFRKGGEDRTHHVHIFEIDSPEAIRHLAFRDYLRVNPAISESYGNLKQHLATQFPTDMERYIEGKNDFVKEIEAKAVKWYKESN